jgi:hypothetical protein
MVLKILFIILMDYKQKQKNKKLEEVEQWIYLSWQKGLQNQQMQNQL